MPIRRTNHAVSAHELRVTLATQEAFAVLSDGALECLACAAVRELVRAGDVLMSAGSVPTAAFVVEHGRLRGLDERVDSAAARPRVLELGRGDICGLSLLVAQLPVFASVVALRDTTVIRLPGAALAACMREHPEMLTAQARQLYTLAHRFRIEALAQPRIFTLLPLGDRLDVDRVVEPFVAALTETLGRGAAIGSKRASEILGVRPDECDPQRLRQLLADWISREEEQGRLVLLVCDREETPWTRWCLEQTDRIVLAAMATDTPAIEIGRRAFGARTIVGSPIAVDLLLAHEADVVDPRGTSSWLALESRRRHHHVRLDRPADFQRAARRIGERPVGVVLGGGGARALAHIGALQAIEEAGIPIDVVGGTSMGAVIAAGYARGRSPIEMSRLFAERVPHARALRDLELPRVSLFAGRKLENILRDEFEDLDFADLWRACFCVSADLVRARMVVHDRARVWEAVRASCSLPGVFPPMHLEGGLLVDGGIVNNVPIDVMAREHSGSTILAIDVGAGGIAAPDGEAFAREPRAGIVQILTSATMLGSKEQLQALVAAGDADLFVVPPVQHVKLLGFDEREALVELGYEHTRRCLAEWDGLARVRLARG